MDTEGRRYIDGVSSLWCNVHGHRHPLIDQAVRGQLERVAHSTMLGLTHPGGAELAARLVDIAPPGLEPRLLLRLGLVRGRGRAQDGVPVLAPARRPARAPDRVRLPRGRLPRGHAGRGLGRRNRALPRASTSHCCSAPTARRPGDAAELERLLERHGEEIAAVIVEPLVQGAAGIRVQPPGYLRAVRELCDRPRRAADLRRGRNRVRAHRDDVRLRAGARRPGLPLPRQGADRRLPAARRHADDRARARRLPRRARGAPHASSTATPSPATRSPARRRSPASTSSMPSTRWCACSRRSAWRTTCSPTSPRCPRSSRSGAAA